MQAEQLKHRGFTAWLTRPVIVHVFSVQYGSPGASEDIHLIVITSQCGWYYFSRFGTERLIDTLKVTQLLRGWDWNPGRRSPGPCTPSRTPRAGLLPALGSGVSLSLASPLAEWWPVTEYGVEILE